MKTRTKIILGVVGSLVLIGSCSGSNKDKPRVTPPLVTTTTTIRNTTTTIAETTITVPSTTTVTFPETTTTFYVAPTSTTTSYVAPKEPVVSTSPVVSSGFTCADGTHSNAAHSQGACSHHGGIK